MKWGHSYEIKNSERLLYLVLAWIISQSAPLDIWLKDILKKDGGLSGDPGWEIDPIFGEHGNCLYRVWADFNVSGIEPDEEIYNADTFKRAVRESLLAFGEAFPEKSQAVNEVLGRYGL
jgi:hypothetical protein